MCSPDPGGSLSENETIVMVPDHLVQENASGLQIPRVKLIFYSHFCSEFAFCFFLTPN